MPSFDIDTEEITAFEIRNRYLFTKSFDGESLFNQFKQYYESDKYRFEIYEEEPEQVRQILDEFFYDLIIEDSWEDSCVATDKQADSSRVLRNSVMRKHRGRHEIFLMKYKSSVGQVIEHGAIPTGKIRDYNGGTHVENRRIVAGPTVIAPAHTSRYKYLPLTTLYKSILL